ncbi:MAG: acetyl-CoA C-acetyltransferase [Chloroflexi bacterium]|nr:acetyl-CoA C-acetyltransferase [Chloroflexota bacterium]
MTTQTRGRDAVFLSGVRSGFGSFGGSLKDLSATQLGATIARDAIAASGASAEDFDHVVFGNVQQTSSDAIYLARHIGLEAGLPIETPALTVNRLCGSGFEAITQGAQQIMLGRSELVLAGGTESMSQAPHVVRGARWGLRLAAQAELEDSLWECLSDRYCGLSMGETADNLAQRYELDRDEVDSVALGSQQRAQQAWEDGVFDDEVTPIMVGRRGRETEFRADEHIRADTTLETLGGLPTVFRDGGVTTAGNASGICDGAAALVVASEEYAEANDLEPIGRLIGWAVAGVDPAHMGIGPAPAIRDVLEQTGLSLDELDLIEVNEAFAAQYLAVERELGLDRERTNVHGGAIAIGHPVGASGARITAHLLHALRREGKRYGLGSACIGGGQGAALIVEAFN